MSDNIIDLTDEFETKQAVQEYYYSTDNCLADLRRGFYKPEKADPHAGVSHVHTLRDSLKKGFGLHEPR